MGIQYLLSVTNKIKISDVCLEVYDEAQLLRKVPKHKGQTIEPLI